MASLAEYFEKNRYQAKYDFGDRVFGHWNKIPFIGSVGSDSVRNEMDGPILTITVDLPIMYDKKIHHVIMVKHKDVRKLVSYDTEENNDGRISSKTSSKEPVLDSNKRKRKSR